MALTAAERRAKIRERLKNAEEPAGTVEATTETFTEEPEPETPTESNHRTIPKPHLPNAATSNRGKPANYKIHVLTALSLAVLVRIAKYGTKALTG